MKIYLVVKKNRYAEIGRQFPLRMEWIKSVQVQILLPIVVPCVEGSNVQDCAYVL